MTDRDSSLIAELERRLYWYREEAPEEEFDAEEVDAICVMLQKLSPMEGPRMSKEEVRRNIMKRIAEEDGLEGADGFSKGADAEEPDSAEKADLPATDGKDRKTEKGDGRKRYLFRKSGYRAAILFVAVFGVALLSLNMVTYAREDKSLFTMIMERVGFVKIVKDTSVEKAITDFDEESEVFYDSWADLDREIKSRVVVPQYIPSGYTLYGIKHYKLNNRRWLKANYYDKEDGHLKMEITLWEDDKEPYREVTIDEKVYTLIPEYSDENTLFYQYDDEYICMISMKNSFYRISGNVELKEMVKVREGLGNIE